jgi:membrane-associated protease RseP (regulator of RpoE activity)
MQESKRLPVALIAVGVLGVMLSMCLGAMAGGAAGWWAGNSAARRSVQQQMQGLPWEWTWPDSFGQILPREPESDWYTPVVSGAVVTDIVPDGPADRAGITVGDVIVALNGKAVAPDNTLSDLVRRQRPGDRVEITLWRNGSERVVSVRLESHPEDRSAAYLGVYFEMVEEMGPRRSD